MKKLNLFFLLGLLALSFNACDDDDDVSLPPIGGFNSADEVGKTDLLAYFPLDGNGNEKISNAAPASSVGTSFATGQKGQCANFNAGYIAYNPIAALTASTASYSVSAWVNVANNKTSATCFVTLTRPDEWAGNFNLMAETGWYNASSDTLVVKGLLVSREGDPASDSWQDSRNDPPKGGDQAFTGANQWTHAVITWDASTSKFLVFANGKKISNPEWEDRKHNGNPLGDLVFNSGISRVVLGGFGTNVPGNGTVEPWQVPMTGKLDEVRIWKKALSAQEIDALYQLEKAGR